MLAEVKRSPAWQRVWRDFERLASEIRTLTRELRELEPKCRKFPGRLRSRPDGFAYKRADREYRLYGEPKQTPTGTRYLFDAKTWVDDTPHWRTLDVSISGCRCSFAEELYPGDEHMQREVVRDLVFATWHLQGRLIELDLGAPQWM